MPQLLRAGELNTGLWGGIFNPIIPVTEDRSILEKLVKAFRVDVLYPVAKSHLLSSAMAMFPWLPWPHLWGRKLLGDGSPDALYSEALDVLAIFQRYSDIGAKRGCILPQWDAGDALASVFLLQFGVYPQIRGRDLAKDYLGALQAKPSPLAIGAVLRDEWGEYVTPIAATADYLRADRGRGEGVGIFWGDPTKFSDLAMFWNLRVSGGRPIFCPSTDSNRLAGAAGAFLRAQWPKLQRLNALARRFRVWLMDQAEIGSAVSFWDAIRPNGSEMTIYPFDRSDLWSEAPLSPVYTFEAHSVLADVDDRGTAVRVTFEEPEKVLPKGWEEHLRSHHWVLTVRATGEYEADNFTLSPPYVPELNLDYGRFLGRGSEEVRVERQGIGIIENVTNRNQTISKLRVREVINGVFSVFGFEPSQSRAGLIAERLIRQCGGLEGCRVFKIPGVRRLLESDEVREGATLSHAKQVIRDVTATGATFDAHKDLFIEYREKPHLTPDDVVTYLLKRAILRAGLRLICPNCTLDSWIPLEALADEFRCEYCGDASILATQLKDRGDWRFRHSGLLARPEGEQGAIPVALTLWRLLHHHEPTGGTFLWTSGLKLKKGNFCCEADVAVIERDRFTDAPAIILGECKGRLPIDAEDVTKLSTVAEVLRGKALDCYLLFSKADAGFTPSELDLFRGLRTHGFPLLLFTAKDLDPYEPYDDSLAKVIPHRYAHALDEIAENSAALYLNETAQSEVQVSGVIEPN